MTIDTLFALTPVADWQAEIPRLATSPRRQPFEPAAVNAVAELSRRILRRPAAREFPDLAALAHWFRPASLAAIVEGAQQTAGAQHLRPRGLAFLIAPANVEILFAYGWLLSLLAGNATIVRVSQKPSAVRDAFIEILKELAKDPDYRPALADTWLISYPHEDAITARLSAACDARLIWGGDATVLKVRSISLKPTAVEGGFADRFSIAALDATAIDALDDQGMADLARRFVNDTLWSDQQACSSPRCVYWVGDEGATSRAQERFWPRFAAASERFADSPAAVMSRTSDLFALAAEGAITAVPGRLGARPSLGRGGDAARAIRDLHSGFGLFVEYRLDRLKELATYLHDKDQTLVVHGFSADQLTTLVENLPNRSLDRIVAPGQATDFAVTWDGTNLFDLLLRRVSVVKVETKNARNNR